MSRLAVLVCLCFTLSGVAAPANVLPFGDFEQGRSEDRPPEFWHWAGHDYLSAYPDWRLVRAGAASGEWCISTVKGRPFVACGYGGRGMMKATVALRADAPNRPVKLRLSWWNRLKRTDLCKTVAVDVKWKRFEVETEAVQGGPMELAVASEQAGARIWADDFRIEAAPAPDQLTETVEQDGQSTPRPIPIVRASPRDLRPLQSYDGRAADRPGRVGLRVSVPSECVPVPYVSGGVPFPRGQLFRRERVRVLDEAGRERPCQAEVLARWPRDRSVMVLLVTVPVPSRPQKLALEFGPSVQAKTVGRPLAVTHARGGVSIDTAAASFVFHQGQAGPTVAGRRTMGPGIAHGDGTVYSARATECRVERRGPLCAVVAVHGEHADKAGRRCGRWVTRYILWRGSTLCQVKHCWINDERDLILPIRSAWFDMGMPTPNGPTSLVMQVGADRKFLAAEVDDPTKAHELALVPKCHDGLFDGRLAVRDFWQNHPSAVEWASDGYRVWLWPERLRGVLIPQGFARQWEWLVDVGRGALSMPFQTTAMPVLQAEPAWVCASGVFEFLLPPDPATFPIFERRVGSIATLGRFSLEQKASRHLYGLFNYGDAPGDGGWSNLESMAGHELFLHWIRTGEREHFDMARLAAEHYRDIDIHHAAGFCHTHCNNHVQSSESWSHAWIQGVRDLYFLRGDLRALEVLDEVGERLLAKPVGWTSGRDWTRPIDNLVDIYAATGDERYLHCVQKHVAELGRRQVPHHAVCGAERHSWYEDRYAAGCAFTWYGCQAMAKLHQYTGDAAVLDILRREVDLSLDVQTKSQRSHAILPGEKLSQDRCAYVLANPFALGRGSTLFPALGYLAEATSGRHYLDLGMKILAHYMLNLRGGSDASATSYATVFLHYAKRLGVGPKDEAKAFEQARDFSYEQWPAGVVNGGFEEDSFMHWDVKKVPGQDFYYDQLVRVGFYLDDKVKRSGRRSLRIHSDNRRRVVTARARFALKPRLRWRASVWVRSDKSMHPSTGLSLREYDTDRRVGVALRPSGETADGWERRTAEFPTVSRTVATWSLTNRRGTGDAWFDDVSIEELGPVYSLLTQNGEGRDWRKPQYPGLTVLTNGAYTPDERMSGDRDGQGKPIPFTAGCLTDGVSKYNHLQKPIPSYAYWTHRQRGTLTFDLTKPCHIRRVRVHVLISARGHGTQRIELREAGPDGPLLGAVEPAANGWNVFDGLRLRASRVALVLTAMPGRAYTTLSEVEIWGEGVLPK